MNTKEQWSPFVEAVEQFFGEAARYARSARTVNIDLYETEGDVVVKAELPGVKASDLEMTVEAGALTLRAKRFSDEEADKKVLRWHSRELWAGDYAATIELPESADAEHVVAEYENGVVVLRFPEVAAAKPKQIKISVGKK